MKKTKHKKEKERIKKEKEKLEIRCPSDKSNKDKLCQLNG